MNSPIHSLKERLRVFPDRFKNGLFEILLRPPTEQLASKTVNYLVMGIAYVLGMFHWVWFIHFGNVEDRFVDWQKFFGFYGVIQKAVLEQSVRFNKGNKLVYTF